MKRIITIVTILLMLSLGGCSVNINDKKADKQEGMYQRINWWYI